MEEAKLNIGIMFFSQSELDESKHSTAKAINLLKFI